MNAAPFDMLKYFDADDDDELKVIQATADDGEWVDIPEPFFPNATLLVVLYQRGLRKIAVQLDERVAEFDLRAVIVRDGAPIGSDR